MMPRYGEANLMPVKGTNRRAFIAALGSAAAWPLLAQAQNEGMPTIGFLGGGVPDASAYLLAAFRRGLGDGGFIEGQNVVVVYRWAQGHFDRLNALGAELVERKVAVVVSSGSATPELVKLVSASVPMVAAFPGDPAKSGLVASLNRPGGNITGVNMFAFALGPKRFELLHELAPQAKLIAVLANPSMPSPDAKKDLQEVEEAARRVGQKIAVLRATAENELEPTFADMKERGADALLVMADPYFNNKRAQIVALAARNSIPAIYEWREFATIGGLMSYGSSITDAYYQIGVYTAKIIKGEKPADLPIVQTVKVELVLNMKTAKTLGLTFPLSLIGRADEVIE
jgi:putative ABC transport system substrate-binding protein